MQGIHKRWVTTIAKWSKGRKGLSWWWWGGCRFEKGLPHTNLFNEVHSAMFQWSLGSFRERWTPFSPPNMGHNWGSLIPTAEISFQSAVNGGRWTSLNFGSLSSQPSKMLGFAPGVKKVLTNTLSNSWWLPRSSIFWTIRSLPRESWLHGTQRLSQGTCRR